MARTDGNFTDHHSDGEQAGHLFEAGASALGGLAQNPAMLFGARALQGAMAADGKVGLMLNVKKADLPAILRVLPPVFSRPTS